MSERDSYPAGVPCWVETLQRDRQAAQSFYSSLFGWKILVSEEDDYAVARVRGRDVAGIAGAPDEDRQAWVTHIRVDDCDTAVAAASQAGATVLRQPVTAEPAGRFAVLIDPVGAMFCVWEAEVREGAQLVNEPGAWSMSALQTGDPRSAIAFYNTVFGWEAQTAGPVTLWRLPGYVGGEPQQPVPRDVVAVLLSDDASPSRWSVDFWVSDLDATAARALDLRGRILVEPHDRPPMRSALLADPAGVTFSVSQVKLSAAA
jgi:uncharacterized protein